MGRALAVADNAAWRGGLALYRAKDYARACPLLRQAAEAAGTHGEIWADLGLCELRWGRKAQSIQASNLAVRYGDEKTRKAAYFNLGLAGVRLVPPDTADTETCVRLQPPEELACARRFVACGKTHPTSFLGQITVRISDLWIFSCEGKDCPRKTPPSPPCREEPGTFCPRSGIDLLHDESAAGTGPLPEWTCKISDAVASRGKQCQQQKGADAAACLKTACAAARHWQQETVMSREEWPELQEELESWGSRHDCKYCAESRIQTQCTLVSINPCSGRAGAVCRVNRSDKNSQLGTKSVSPPKTTVREFIFSIAPLPGG
ncbi:tetratricopeptide repeat protein [Myxococcus landrumensis]|uniref:Tetratricopeptide repeat protein n=1 Tax=Myxococcus landrumensis TaxID=2813577 RepID=A0ABX7NFG4_9BACT|nr:hypothetical protein [Myxococcus landrumus]QSQ17403.1 hypothetical protein JY572_15705 [Myxococcus landrumus]